jgi:hypothetical protein
MEEERKLDNIAQEIKLLREVAESAVKLLSPPYRRRNGTAPSYQSELRDWDKLAEDLVNAGYDWEEYT